MSIELIEEFSISINHRTFGVGDWVDGLFVNGAITDVSIDAVVQPLIGEELQQFFGGERTKEAVKIWTTVKLSTANEKTQVSADQLTIGAQIFEIQEVRVWKHGNDLPHYESIAVRLNDEGQQNA